MQLYDFDHCDDVDGNDDNVLVKQCNVKRHLRRMLQRKLKVDWMVSGWGEV